MDVMGDKELLEKGLGLLQEAFFCFTGIEDDNVANIMESLCYGSLKVAENILLSMSEEE